MNTENTKNSKSDIRENGGLMPYVSDTYRAYALLARMDRPIGIWLLLLPSLCGGFFGGGECECEFCAVAHFLYMVMLFGVGAVAMRSAGVWLMIFGIGIWIGRLAYVGGLWRRRI